MGEEGWAEGARVGEVDLEVVETVEEEAMVEEEVEKVAKVEAAEAETCMRDSKDLG